MGGCSSSNHKGKRHTGDLGSVLANLHHTRKGWLNTEHRGKTKSDQWGWEEKNAAQTQRTKPRVHKNSIQQQYKQNFPGVGIVGPRRATEGERLGRFVMPHSAYKPAKVLIAQLGLPLCTSCELCTTALIQLLVIQGGPSLVKYPPCKLLVEGQVFTHCQ